MTYSLAEENYLKAIYHKSETSGELVSTNALAAALNINAASVTDMFKRLQEHKLVSYTKSKGVKLTQKGNRAALQIIRRHRLWETFLVEKLNFAWDEVHEVAEQLEHIQSDLLIEKLDVLLGYPRFDPHGDPIPDKNGKIPISQSIPLSTGTQGTPYKLQGVGSNTDAFLKYLNKIELSLGDTITIKEIEAFDHSLTVVLNPSRTINISKEVSENLLVVKN